MSSAAASTSASSQRPPSAVVHQDYIARIRYSNVLPPPPTPPKLLDMPGTGLAGGHYTSAAYASKMAREQPLNIEADAELGMPIDLLGIPGIFNGDERAIYARPAPVLDPKDKLLCRPLQTLGKANNPNHPNNGNNGTAAGVSFLRRTEYVSSQGTQHFSSSTSKDLLRLRSSTDATKRRRLGNQHNNMNKDDPINLLRHIVKGFDLAYPRDAYKGDDPRAGVRGAGISDVELQAWTQPSHPSKSDLHLLDSYPLLPDLDALPTTGAYMVTKFLSNPCGSASEVEDPRLNSAILRPISDPRTAADHARRLAEWTPASGRPQPLPEYDFDYYQLLSTAASGNLKRKFDIHDAENESEELYVDDLAGGGRGFKFARVRRYETYNQHGDTENYYNDSVALALHDPDLSASSSFNTAANSNLQSRTAGRKRRLAKAAYYYPIIQRTALRPVRVVGKDAFYSSQVLDEERIDELNVTVGEWGEEERARQLEKRAELDRSVRIVDGEAGAVAVGWEGGSG